MQKWSKHIISFKIPLGLFNNIKNDCINIKNRTNSKGV